MRSCTALELIRACVTESPWRILKVAGVPLLTIRLVTGNLWLAVPFLVLAVIISSSRSR